MFFQFFQFIIGAQRSSTHPVILGRTIRDFLGPRKCFASPITLPGRARCTSVEFHNIISHDDHVVACYKTWAPTSGKFRPRVIEGPRIFLVFCNPAVRYDPASEWKSLTFFYLAVQISCNITFCGKIIRIDSGVSRALDWLETRVLLIGDYHSPVFPQVARSIYGYRRRRAYPAVWSDYFGYFPSFTIVKFLIIINPTEQGTSDSYPPNEQESSAVESPDPWLFSGPSHHWKATTVSFSIVSGSSLAFRFEKT